MTQPQQEKQIKEVIEIKVSDGKEKDTLSASDGSSVYSTEGSEISAEGYIHDLQWTEEEERAVVNKIDIRLMSFVLLMTFVLNMDRTNICKAWCLLYIKYAVDANTLLLCHSKCYLW